MIGSTTDRLSLPGAAVALITILAGIVYLPGLSSLPLCDSEESRCAMVVAGMLRTGDYLVPRQGGSRGEAGLSGADGNEYFEKPPLFSWLAAAATVATGGMELGGRLISALSGLGTALCVCYLGRRMFSPRAGLLAGVASVVCLMHLGLARWYRQEMLFAFLVVAVLTFFWCAHTSVDAVGRPLGRKSRAWYGFFLCAALATLAKGPIGLLLPVLVIVGYLAAMRQWRRMLELVHWRGWLIYAAVAVPWFAYMTATYWPRYAQQFFIASHLDRAAAGRRGHVYGPWFYFAVLAGGMIPWTILLPGMVRRSFPRFWRKPALSQEVAGPPVGPERSPATFLWSWTALIILFFTASQTKFVHYILPAMAPLMVLAGEYLVGLADRRGPAGGEKWFIAMCRASIGVAVFLAVALVGADVYLLQSDQPRDWLAIKAAVGRLEWTVVLAAASLAALSVGAIAYAMRKGKTMVVFWTVIAGTTFAYVFAALHAMPRAYERMSCRSEARVLAGVVAPTEHVIFKVGEDPSLALYLGRADAPFGPSAVRIGEELRRRPATVVFRKPRQLEDIQGESQGVRFGPVVSVTEDLSLVRTEPDEAGRSQTSTRLVAPSSGGVNP